jgi:hypothetical protein
MNYRVTVLLKTTVLTGHRYMVVYSDDVDGVYQYALNKLRLEGTLGMVHSITVEPIV